MVDNISELTQRIEMNERSKVTKSRFWGSRHKHIATILYFTIKRSIEVYIY